MRSATGLRTLEWGIATPVVVPGVAPAAVAADAQGQGSSGSLIESALAARSDQDRQRANHVCDADAC